MSISRKFDKYNENCVVCFEKEGDARIFMPLCGETDCLPGYTISRSHSAEWVFEYVVRGSGTFRCNDHFYQPRAGDLYIAPCGSTHVYRSNDHDPWYKLWFNLQGTLIAELACFYGIEHLEFLPQCGLEAVFREGLAAMRNRPERAMETASLVAHQLIFRIAAATAGERPVPDTALRLRRALDARLSGGESFAAIARDFHYTESQLTRIFRAAYGETPYAYMLSRRLQLARVMLRNATLNIKEIAARTGFGDPYYFSNLFKRKFGMSPRAYREKQRD